MQVFVPSSSVRESVRVLDNRRLGKQRVETYQIVMNILGVGPGERPVYKRDGSPKLKPNGKPVTEWDGTFHDRPPKGWSSHPAVIAWRENVGSLLIYQAHTCIEWEARGYRDTCWQKTRLAVEYRYPGKIFGPKMPDWWGDESVHSSHRAALLYKEPEWYSQFGWTETPAYEYVWPTSTGVLV